MVRLLLLANVVNGYYKNNEHLVRARPHSQELVPGSALGYTTQGCSSDLPQVPGDMCLVHVPKPACSDGEVGEEVFIIYIEEEWNRGPTKVSG